MAQPLKDLVDRAVVEDLATRLSTVEPAFDGASFVADLNVALAELELKPRIEAIARRIGTGLSDEYRTALRAVVEVARAEPPISGFAAWPLCTFVEVFGVDDPEASLAAMEHLTLRASCEFAIRPFLREHWDAAYAKLEVFTHHPAEAVRRLSSEGMRPRLPWGTGVPRLRTDPLQGLALLERLRHDPSETVRRSVANHLNDVAKDHPDLVVETTSRWSDETPPVTRELVAHALRTLVKDGDPGALAVLGFTTDASVDVVDFAVSPAVVSMGDRIELTTTLRSTSKAAQRLVVDFVVHHVNAAGGLSPKVFKWAVVELGAGAETTLQKRRLIQHASTRTYYPGTHRADLQVAGAVVARRAFEVEV